MYAAIENNNIVIANYLIHQLNLLEDNEEIGLGFCWPNYGYRYDYFHEITPLTLAILIPGFKEIGKYLIKQGGYTCIDAEMDISNLLSTSNRVLSMSAKTILKIETQWEQEIVSEEKAKMSKQLANFKQKIEHLQQENMTLKQENQSLKKIILTAQSQGFFPKESLSFEKANLFQTFSLKQ